MRSGCAVVAVSLALAMSNAALAQTTLRAGAAKVDITPSTGELPKNNVGILDHLFARAIVLESGATSAALITLDAGAIPDALWQTVSSQIEKGGIPPQRVLLTATHTHSAGGREGQISVKRSWSRFGSRSRADRCSHRAWHRRLVHQRQPSNRRSENRPVVGGGQLRRAVG